MASRNDSTRHLEWRLPEQHFSGRDEGGRRTGRATDRHPRGLPPLARGGRESAEPANRTTARLWLRLPAMIGFAALLLAVPNPLAAQTAQDPDAAPQTARDPWRDVTFGATLEAYYQYNANHPRTASRCCAPTTRAPIPSAIQQAGLLVELAAGAGRRPPLWAAPRPDVRSGDGDRAGQRRQRAAPRRLSPHLAGLRVLCVSGRPRACRSDFGKFASNLGYETNYAKDNQAFSRSFLFNSCRTTTPACVRRCPCTTR